MLTVWLTVVFPGRRKQRDEPAHSTTVNAKATISRTGRAASEGPRTCAGPARSAGVLRSTLGGGPSSGTGNGGAGSGSASARRRPLRARPNPWLDEVGWARPGLSVPRFDGMLTVYRIRRSQVGRIRDHAMGWGRFATATDVEVLPGNDHHAILREPGVRELARRVREALVDSVVETP